MLAFRQMKKTDLVREIARTHKVAQGGAADQMDRTVTRILRTLRGGKPAHIPGLGTITPGKQWGFRPEPNDD
jgi:nucleoid DNA-binding protein